MHEKSISILKSHKLRITDSRIEILKHFLEMKSVFSQRDLELAYPQFDRVTIYRTLNNFLDVGLLHKIPNESGTSTFAFCDHSGHNEHYFENHIHFKCNCCGQIECLDEKEVPQVTVPKGYQLENVNLIVDGTCPSCSDK